MENVLKPFHKIYVYLKKAFTLPIHVTVIKASAKVIKVIFDSVDKWRDLKNNNYCTVDPFEYNLLCRVGPLSAETLAPMAEQIETTTRQFVNHRFDILGSGWVGVYHGMKCRGLEGYKCDMGGTVQVDTKGRWLEGRIKRPNLAEAQKIWRIVDPDYTPIDWHIDFKSGYRWSESAWYKDIKCGHKPGVDVKVPWELARMQHLPKLVWAYMLSKEGVERFRPPDIYVREFRNQVLDFIATNPPRYGVNWTCTMDVSIRAINWLLAYDLFRSGKAKFDEKFEAVFVRSIYAHGLHIVSNLEWYHKQRGNHYLADIAGLAFIAAYLPSTAETEAWLAFAVQELITEMEHQFYPDGGNFEGSTYYHRLSAEIFYFTTTLILGLSQERLEILKSYNHKMLRTGLGKPKLKAAPLPFFKLPQGSTLPHAESPFPAWYFERMERMAEFILDITKSNGHIPQIGDNDSGRFLKLSPKYVKMTVKLARETYANLNGYTELPDDADYLFEDHLDCSHLVAAAYGLFARDDFAEWLGGQEKALCMPDCFLIQSLSGNRSIGSQRFDQRQKEDSDFFSIGKQGEFKNILSEMLAKPKEQIRITEFPVHEGDLREGITIRSYPDFGLYLYTSPRLYLAVRCWPGSNPFNSGHMHNDQLSIELLINGEELVTDPGTYLYTPMPDLRDNYRSVKAHFTPWIMDNEPSTLKNGLFCLSNPSKGNVLVFGKTAFYGTLFNVPCQRLIELSLNKIKITDYSADPYDLHKKHLPKKKHSPCYGWYLKD